MWDTSRINRK